MKKLFNNNRLEYLDNILKELAKEMGTFVSEDILAPKVSFEEIVHKNFGSMTTTKKDIPVGKERAIFRTATIYLENEGLIIRKTLIPEIPDYMISFKGLELIERGGLIKQTRNERIKDVLQKIVWFVAILAFGVNTWFQILNYYNETKNTCDKCISTTPQNHK